MTALPSAALSRPALEMRGVVRVAGRALAGEPRPGPWVLILPLILPGSGTWAARSCPFAAVPCRLNEDARVRCCSLKGLRPVPVCRSHGDIEVYMHG